MNDGTGVVAVLATYTPGPASVHNVAGVIGQVDRVVIVDDGSPGAASVVFEELAALGAEVVRLATNGGIARALNVGVKEALVSPATQFVLTLDQDTLVSDDLVARLTSLFHERHTDAHVGIVVPALVSGRPVPTSRRSGRQHIPREPIQSGMLIARDVFEAVGGFREEFFIDCVDTDFFLRAKRGGFLTMVCPGASITHELGEHLSTLPGRPGIAFHPPFRRFYMTRNRLVLIREYAREREWLMHTLVAETMGLLLTLVRGTERPRQLRAVKAGVHAYRKSELGRIPAGLRADLERDPERG